MSVVPGLTDAQESYLQTVYVLEAEHGAARVKGVTAQRGVKAPSVTVVMQALADKGLVCYERYGSITLTESGRQAGRALLLRRKAVEDFLANVLGVAASESGDIAERIEHHLPEAVLCRLVQFVDHYKRRVRAKFAWGERCSELCADRYGVECVHSPARRAPRRRKAAAR